MNNKGMVSIEAAIIIPICIAVTMLLIWLGIYYYNQNVIDEYTSKAAIMGSHIGDLDNNEIQDITMEEALTSLKDKLVMIKDLDVEVSVSFGEVTVEASASLNIPNFFLFLDVYKEGAWNIHTVTTAPRLRNSSFVRMINNLFFERNTYE